jgi:hypothetical protein
LPTSDASETSIGLANITIATTDLMAATVTSSGCHPHAALPCFVTL